VSRGRLAATAAESENGNLLGIGFAERKT